VNLQEVDFKTMESKICPGLYFAGEELDIDELWGDLIFKALATTGYLAGQAMGNNICINSKIFNLSNFCKKSYQHLRADDDEHPSFWRQS
jgi:hypothetical protein